MGHNRTDVIRVTYLVQWSKLPDVFMVKIKKGVLFVSIPYYGSLSLAENQS
jgi:hypothetical protein